MAASEIVALIDWDAADDVGRFLDALIPFIQPKGPDDRAAKWQEVADALMAIANDTDAIRTRTGGPAEQFRRAPDCDESAVYSGDEYGETYPVGLPWIFEDQEGRRSYLATEAEACALQRDHRRALGFDEMTGLPAGLVKGA